MPPTADALTGEPSARGSDPGGPGVDWYTSAVAAIDAANAADPNLIMVGGVARPKELVHAEVVERWVRRLDPEATDTQLLAARAHHLRRWVVPRDEYPADRAGYLRWRADHKRRQAAEVAQLLDDVGYDHATQERVADLVAKRDLARDPQVQVHEDALCLAFLELQLEELADLLGDDRTVEVVRKTVAKMSQAALGAAPSAVTSPDGRRLLALALTATPPEAATEG